MKKILTAIIAAVLLTGLAAAAYAETPDIILVTVYEQEGWGDRISVGFAKGSDRQAFDGRRL